MNNILKVKTNGTETTATVDRDTFRNIGRLEGLLSEARKKGKRTTIIDIPVELLAIDEKYQTPLRTDRKLNYLINNFDDNRLLPLTVVPHNEEGKAYVVDGYGRLKASQIVNPEKYKTLECMVILTAPEEPEERRRFEANEFRCQTEGISAVKPLHKHGANLCLHDRPATEIQELMEEYGFIFVKEKGNRSNNILGSYSELYNICRSNGKECAKWIFDVCKKARFDEKSNGYSTYVMRSLRDIWKFYPENRNEVADYISLWLREREPQNFKAKASARYGLLDYKLACSLYLEDLVVDNVDLSHVRTVEGRTVTLIAGGKKTA